MKKTKIILTAFAVIVSLLMIMTPTMARPIAEKTTMDVVETAEQKLINQLETLNLKLSRDVKANNLIRSLTQDSSVAQSIEILEQAVTEEEMSMAFEQLIVSLEGKSELTQLEALIEQNFQSEVEQLEDLIIQEYSSELPEENTNDMGGIELILYIITWIVVIILYIPIIILYIRVLINAIENFLDWLEDLFGNGDSGETPGF